MAANVAKMASERFVEGKLAGKADKDEVESLLFPQYYPDGSVTSAAEFTAEIRYDAPDTANRTITVKPFCNTGTVANDNSNLSGRVVMPPFVDASGNGYISDDGTRFKVVGVSSGTSFGFNTNITAIVASSTVTTLGTGAFIACTSLTDVSLPAATSIGDSAFLGCTSLTDVSFPAATSIEGYAFAACTSLTSVDFGDTPRSSVPSLGVYAFDSAPTSCKIIVPYTQYDAWIAADGWKDLPQEFVRHAEKADKPATFTAGNLAALDANGNLADSGKAPGNFLPKTGGTVNGDLEVIYGSNGNGFTVKDASGNYLRIRHGVVAGDFWYVDYSVANVGNGSLRLPYDSIIPIGVFSLAGSFDTSTTYALNSLCVYSDERLYRCVNPNGHTGAWVAADFAVATVEDVLAALRTGKADATSLAPTFSSDSTVQYAVGSRCTYNGKLYKCTTATTGGAWVAGSWAEDTMTDPDAVLDITAQNRLRVVAKDGTLLWAQGYDLASASSATLACDAVNNFTFADGATSQAFALPAAPTGKVGDFGLDIDNSANASAATMTLTGLDTTFSVVVPKGKSLNDMLAIAAGELARFYITLTTFRVNNLPTWHIAKQIVENGGATA